MAFEERMGREAVRRVGPGRPRKRPGRVVGDKAYSIGKIRASLPRRGIRVMIPRRKNERGRGRFDKAVYRLRHGVERLFHRLKQFRRVARRYEKRAQNYRNVR